MRVVPHVRQLFVIHWEFVKKTGNHTLDVNGNYYHAVLLPMFLATILLPVMFTKTENESKVGQIEEEYIPLVIVPRIQ